jgi:RNA polymerase sigma-70 factor (ECF subfamily)
MIDVMKSEPEILIRFDLLRKQYHRGIITFLAQDSSLKREDREDIAQEVLIKIYRNMDKLDSQKSPGPWIYTISRRTLIDFKKRRENTPKLSEFNEENYFTGNLNNPENQYEKKEELEKLHRIMKDFSTRSRQLLYLTYWEGLTNRETGKAMEMPAGTVKYELFRLRKAIRRLWSEE